MEFRLATLSDLDRIKRIYTEIVQKMQNEGLEVWDNIYPVQFIEEDILNCRFYLMSEGLAVLAGVAISKKHAGEQAVSWTNPKARAMYIDRLGVNVHYLHKGIASKMIAHSIAIAKSQAVEYLRLFVVDSNTPAMELYEKNNFLKRHGIYREVIDDQLSLKQYAYEIEV